MKSQVESSKQVFPPVKLTITNESQDELDAFGSLFNHTKVNEGFISFGVNGSVVALSEKLESAGAEVHRVDVFAKTFRNYQ